MNNNIKGFFDHQNLFENLQMAKDYLVKKYAEKSNKKVSELDPEEKNKALNDPKFKNLQDIFRMKEWKKKDSEGNLTTPPNPMPPDPKVLNYIPFFTKFLYEQDADFGRLEELLELLKKYSTNLDKDLPKKIQDYTKIYSFANKKNIENSIKEDPRNKRKSEEEIQEMIDSKLDRLKRDGIEFNLKPGFELLIDDINEIEGKIALRRMQSKLLPRMKSQFSNATPRQLERLKQAALIMNTKEPKYMEVTDTKTKKTEWKWCNAWEDFGKIIGQYENNPDDGEPNPDPDLLDSKKAFSILAEISLDFARNWGVKKGMNQIVDTVQNDLGPRAGILYYDDRFVVASARNHEAVLKLLPGTPYCVKNESSYWSYNTGRLQLIIWDLEKDALHRYRSMGLSVNGNLSIHTIFDKNNASMPFSGKKLEDLLKWIGFSQEGIKETNDNFPKEYKIKMCLELIYNSKRTNSGSLKDRLEFIISSLIGVIRGAEEGILDLEQWRELSNAVTTIVSTDDQLGYKNFIDYYLKNGIVSNAGLEVFDTIVKDMYTPEEIKKIYDRSIASFNAIEQNVKFSTSKFARNVNPESVELWKKSLETKEEILKKLQSKL